MQIKNYLILAFADLAEPSDLEAIVEIGLDALSTIPKWNYRSLRLYDYLEDTRTYREIDASTSPTTDAGNGASQLQKCLTSKFRIFEYGRIRRLEHVLPRNRMHLDCQVGLGLT